MHDGAAHVPAVLGRGRSVSHGTVGRHSGIGSLAPCISTAMPAHRRMWSASSARATCPRRWASATEPSFFCSRAWNCGQATSRRCVCATLTGKVVGFTSAARAGVRRDCLKPGAGAGDRRVRARGSPCSSYRCVVSARPCSFPCLEVPLSRLAARRKRDMSGRDQAPRPEARPTCCVIRLPVRCCEAEPHCRTFQLCYGTASPRPRRFMQRSM